MAHETNDELSQLAKDLRQGRWADLASRLGFSTHHSTPVPVEASPAWGIDKELAAQLDALSVLAAESTYRLMLAVGELSFQTLRRMMTSLYRLNREQLVLWWWVRDDTLTTVVVDERVDGRIFCRRMDIMRGRPDPMGLGQLRALDIDDLAGEDLEDSACALRRHVNDVLDQQKLTRQFFDDFRAVKELLCDDMVDGPSNERDRHDIALTTLLRLVFLYFLQVRGALDGDRRFVLRKLRAARAQHADFYRDVLRPLFFGALNRPADHRDELANALGQLPFLNGGLFEPLPSETPHDRLTWPSDVWDTVIEGLLERYHFAVEESQGADQQRAVDPEMLGRVFEGLMYADTRRSSGSFYTPRDIVRRLVDRALRGYLGDTSELTPDQIDAVLAGQPPPGLNDSMRADVQAALDSVQILDPAVGTGAFLLEALQVLRRARRSLTTGHTSAEPTSLDDYRQVRALIHDHIFGVDIHHTAVRLCELRLWLTLLTTLPRMPIDDMPPLPNLSHKVCVGNSLLSPTDLVSLRVDAQAFGSSTRVIDGSSHRQRLAKIKRARQTYLTSHGAQKHAALSRIRTLEGDVQRAMLVARKDMVEQQLEPLEKLAASDDLFGDDVELTDAQQREVERLRAHRAALQQALDDVDADRQAPLAFSYASRFSPTLADGGFDIVITNPPWVRASHIDAAQRDLLRARYRCHRSALWPAARAAGIRAPFGPQVDLSALFVERSLELLRPGGRLCGLVPSKLFRSLHGAGLRQVLSDHALVGIEDYSDGDRRMFDATVYPAMLHVQKRPQSRPNCPNRPPRKSRQVELSVWHGDTRQSWTTDADNLCSSDAQPGAPWIFAAPRRRALFDRMRRVSHALGEVETLQPVRGLFTGCNQVFVGDHHKMQQILGDYTDAFSRRVLSGRDVRPWSLETSRHILWPYDDQFDFRDDLPEVFRAYFGQHRQQLRARSDYRAAKPLWQMYRLKQGLLSPKVVWRDLSPKLEAAVAPAALVPLNTVYFIPLADNRRARLLTGLFNSRPLRALARVVAERARGGWRRHFAWVMRLLPVPRRLVAYIGGAADKGLDDHARAMRRDRAAAVDLMAAELFELSPDEVNVVDAGFGGAQEAA